MPRLRFPGFTEAWEERLFSSLYRYVCEKNDGTFREGTIISVANMYFKADVKIVGDDYLLTYNVLRLGDIAFEGHRSKEFAYGRFVENTIGDGIISHVFVVFRPILPSHNIVYWQYAINNERTMRGVLARCTKAATMMMSIVPSDFLSQKILVPSNNEQAKIGSLLSLVDARIAAQRKLVELLKKHKKGLLQNLFTGESSKLPRYRFASFKGLWVSYVFGEMFSFLKNNTLPRSEMTAVEGTIRNVHYGDVLIKYGDVLDCNRDQIPFLANERQSDTCRLLQDGDVVIADTAEDEAVGKAVELAGVANKLIESGLHTIACRPKIPFAPCFLGYYLNSTVYRRQLLPLMQGIKVLSLSKSQLGKTQLLFPKDLNEQKRIAELLTGIDSHIAVAQSNLDRIQFLKTGLLQKLFV